jgi:filamentous hemagglutinin family protein
VRIFLSSIVPRVALLLNGLLVIQGLFSGLWANPAGEQVISGGATFQRGLDGSLTITQGSDKAIIHWQDFSIGAGELTKFVQPSSTSAALNRVISGLPSSIHGTLQANGRVFLINPNGILVGPTGRIDVGGFIASTLDVSDGEFLAGGDMIFRGSSAASVVNQGTINAIGGDIFLFAQTVQNSGTLNAPQGTVGLGAGTEILLKQAGDERVFVRAGNGTVTNSGTVSAATAELKAHGNLYALAVNNTGVIRATSASKKGGRVFLTATGGGTVRNSGSISARGSGGAGGEIKLDAGPTGKVENSGTLDADAILTPETGLPLETSTLPEEATPTGSTEPAGQAEAKAAAGGQIVVMAGQIDLLEGSMLRANGIGQGGVILVGGGFQGNDPKVINATKVRVDPGATLQADGGTAGGRVIVWSDGDTVFAGRISARATGAEGQGGFAEVSGKQTLGYTGVADLRGAGSGETGTLLLDPSDFTITASEAATITTNLATSNVVVSTSGVGVQPGNISVFSSIVYTSVNSLTLLAHRDVFFAANVQNSGTGAVQVVAGWDGFTGFGGPSGLTTGTVNFNTIVNAGAYGLDNGRTPGTSSIQINTSTSTLSWAVGSRFGATNMAALNLVLFGGNAIGASTQVGYRTAPAGTNSNATGAITLRLKGTLTATGGTQSGAGVQIGHGVRDSALGTEPDGNLSGNISVVAGGNVTFAGGNQSGAQLGHGGEAATGTHSGTITVSTPGAITLNGGILGGWVKIGNGGYSADGDATGAISVTAGGNISLTGGGGSSFVQIGNGGLFSGGNHSGNIDVSGVAISVLAGAGHGAYAHIGHGGHDGTGNLSGTVHVTATGNLTLTGGPGTFSGAWAAIGHGVTTWNGNVSGDVVVSVGGSLSLAGSQAASGLGQSFAMIGHTAPGTRQGLVDVRVSGQTTLVNGVLSSSPWRIGHTSGGTSGADVFFSTGTLAFSAGIGTSVSPDADFVAKFIANLNGGRVTVASTGAGGLTIANPWVSASSNSLTFLSTRDIAFSASVQNNGTGAVQAVAGWDGSTGITAGTASFASILSANAYGLNNGSIQIGGTSSTTNVSVGSRFGATDVAGLNLSLFGSATTGNSAGQLGYLPNFAVSNFEVNGDISVRLKGNLIATGGSTGGSHAFIGHGGRDTVPGIEPEGNLTGAISVITGGNITLTGGVVSAGRIGHGGEQIAGALSGTITVSAGGNITGQGGSSGGTGWVQIGHGSSALVASGQLGNATGDIFVTAIGNLNLFGGNMVNSWAQIGHGNRLGNGDHSGNITVTAANVTLRGGGGNAATQAQIGHGGFNVFGNFSGAITVNTSHLTLQGGTFSSAFAQIGHGGNTSSGNFSGAIGVTVTGNLSLLGSTSATNAYAMIGHGEASTAGNGTRQGNVEVRVAGESSLVNGGPTASGWGIGHKTIPSHTISNANLIFTTRTLDYTLNQTATYTELSSDFATKFVSNLAGGNVTVASTGPGPLYVTGAFNYSSNKALAFLARDDISVFFDVQNSAASPGGDITLVAGWDGITGVNAGQPLDLAAILASPVGYGSSGSEVRIGTGQQQVAVSVGSRFGTTNVAADSLHVIGSKADFILPDPPNAGAQLGFRAPAGVSSYSISGPINVLLRSKLEVTGGTYSGSWAQVGNGGRGNGNGPLSNSFGGDITIIAPTSVNVHGGGDISSMYQFDAEFAYAQIGNGGMNANGSHSGNLTVTTGVLSIVSGISAPNWAALGNGGYGSDGNHSGNIKVVAQRVQLFGIDPETDNYTQIGHGGALADGNHSGSIVMSTGALELSTIFASFGSQRAMIGHGSNSAIATTGTRQGLIDVRVGTVTEFDGIPVRSLWIIGHRSSTPGGVSNSEIYFSTGSFGTPFPGGNLGVSFMRQFALNAVNTNSPVTVAHTGLDNITVQGAFTYNGPSAFTLLSKGNITFNASLQNSGSGAINIAAGWDGVTGLAATPGNGPSMNFAAIEALPSGYGNNQGTVNIGSGSQTVSIAVGSAGGATQIAAYALNVNASTTTAAGIAQVGYRGVVGGTGAFDINLKSHFDALNRGTVSTTQIGHGASVSAGSVVITSAFNFSRPFSFAALARGDVSFLGGQIQNSAGSDPGSGGAVAAIAGWNGTSGVASGSPTNVIAVLNAGAYGLSGGSVIVGSLNGVTAGSSIGSRYASTTVGGSDVRLYGNGTADPTQRFAQIGYRVSGSTTGMHAAGNISVQAKGTFFMSGLAFPNSDMQIGHGGRGVVLGSGPGGDWSGDISVQGAVMIISGNGTNGGYAQVGHGGAGTSGTRAGNIVLNATHTFVEAISLGAATHIGHGGQDQVGDASGDIHIFAKSGLRMGSGALLGTQVGHGGNRAQGLFSGAIDVVSEKGVVLNPLGVGGGFAQIGHGGDSAGGVFSGDIHVKGHFIELRPINSMDPAQIGHGGNGSTANQSGGITVETDHLILKGSETGLSHAHIGHGDGLGLSNGTRQGGITVQVAQETSLEGGTGSAPLWLIGHRTSMLGGVSNATVSLTNRTLDAAVDNFALDVTLDESFATVFGRNLAGGDVHVTATSFYHDIINLGNWSYNSPHHLTFTSGRGITLGGYIVNSGVGSLTFITDSLNPYPFMDTDARFINYGRGTSSGGGVTVYAPSVRTSILGSLAQLPRQYGVWYGDPNALIGGVNFKDGPPPFVMANDITPVHPQPKAPFIATPLQPDTIFLPADFHALGALMSIPPGNSFNFDFSGGVLFLDTANSEGAEYEAGHPPQGNGSGSLLHQNSAGVAGEEKKKEDKKEHPNGEQPGT